MVYSKKYYAKKKFIAIGLILFLLLATIAVGYRFLDRKLHSAEDTDTVNVNTGISTSLSKSKLIVRAKEDIMPGDLADKTRFELVELPDYLLPDDAVASLGELNDARIKNRLTAKQFVMKNDLIAASAWYDNEDRLVEHIFQPGAIPASVSIGSIVDIKLFRQGAEDYVVVSKAVVISKVENTLSFYLNTQEQEYLKEAAGEGMLFLTQYLDISQTPSEITYKTSFVK